MMRQYLFLLLPVCVLSGCRAIAGLSDFTFGADDSDSSTETDMNTDTDTDTDADADTDTDTDTDSASGTNTDSEPDASVSDTDSDTASILEPEIQVKRDSTNSVLEVDDVVDFGEVLIDQQATEIFTIHNSGNEVLNISAINILRDVSDFSLTEIDSLPASVSPGDSIQFQISCEPSEQETVVLEVSIENNDSDESLFEFMLRAAGVYKPIIEVRMGNSTGEILSDGDTVYASSISAGTTGYTAFYVANVGNQTLCLQSVTTDSPYFEVFDFTETYIAPAPNVSGKYQEIGFSSESVGVYSTDVAFGSDDPDTPFFYVTLVGTAE